MFSTEFLLTSLVVVLIPGTGVIYTISTGLFLGGRASIAAASGCTAGIIPHLAASVLGLSAIIHMSAVAFQMVKYAGGIYLLHPVWDGRKPCQSSCPEFTPFSLMAAAIVCHRICRSRGQTCVYQMKRNIRLT